MDLVGKTAFIYPRNCEKIQNLKKLHQFHIYICEVEKGYHYQTSVAAHLCPFSGIPMLCACAEQTSMINYLPLASIPRIRQHPVYMTDTLQCKLLNGCGNHEYAISMNIQLHQLP